jgi:uncharacterized protein
MSIEKDRAIFYVEFPAKDLAQTEAFYTQAFRWVFTAYGPEYLAFEDGHLAGGFYQSDAVPPRGGALVVIWADDLAGALQGVEGAGGVISVPIFEYPGGRRFHFTDPSGNELSVCSRPLA